MGNSTQSFQHKFKAVTVNALQEGNDYSVEVIFAPFYTTSIHKDGKELTTLKPSDFKCHRIVASGTMDATSGEWTKPVKVQCTDQNHRVLHPFTLMPRKHVTLAQCMCYNLPREFERHRRTPGLFGIMFGFMIPFIGFMQDTTHNLAAEFY